MKILKQAVNDEVAEVLADAGAEGDLSELLGPATVEEHGDLALPCHSLAPLLKRSPVDIAESISSTLAPILAGIAEVSAVSGFVNIKAEPEWLAARLGDLLPDDRLGVAIEETRVAAVDYSAPNVAKEMHVGHLRSTVIGDAIVRMLMHKGHTVHRENHVGDWGTPFGCLLYTSPSPRDLSTSRMPSSA